jgi:putative membrane protein
MMMCEPKRQHPSYILIVFLEQIKNVFISLLILLLPGHKSQMFQYIFTALVIILPVVSALIKWYRFTYIVTDDEIRIKSGLFVIENTFIKKERIQSVSITEGIIQQIFRVVSVKIEVAGGKKNDCIINAILKEDAKKLLKQLHLSKKIPIDNNIDTKEQKSEVDSDKITSNAVLSVSIKRLILAGITSFEVGLGAAIFASIFSNIEDLIPSGVFRSIYIQLQSFSFLMFFLLFIICLVFALCFTTLRYVLKFANFKLSFSGTHLNISRGLFEKNEFSLSTKRIHGIVIQEGFFRQLIGFATVYVEAVGASDKQENKRHVIHPFIKKKDIPMFLHTFIPMIDYTEAVHSPPSRARKGYYGRSVTLFFLISLLLVSIPFIHTWIFSILLVGLIIGEIRYQYAGFSLIGRTLILRSGFFSKTTAIIPKDRIQVLTQQQSFLQKNSKLKTISATILSSQFGRTYKVRSLDELDVNTIMNWFS